MKEHESKNPIENVDCDSADHHKFISHAREDFELARDYAVRECREPGQGVTDGAELSFRQMLEAPQLCTNPYITGPLLLGISLLQQHESTYVLNDIRPRGFTKSSGDHPPLSLPPRADIDPVDQLLRRAKNYLAISRAPMDIFTDVEAGTYVVEDFLTYIGDAFRREGVQLRRQLRFENLSRKGREVGPLLNAVVLIAEMMTTFDGSPNTAEGVLQSLQYPESAINVSQTICSTMKWEDSQPSVREFIDSLVRHLDILGDYRRCFTLTADCPDARYVQFLLMPYRAVIVEVISNLHGMDWALSADDEDELRAMGFHEPAYGPLPNWWQEYRAKDNLQELQETIERVMFVVFKEQPWEIVDVRLREFKLAEGQTLADYLYKKRAYSVAMSDPKEVSRFLGELDDPEVRSNWLSDE